MFQINCRGSCVPSSNGVVSCRWIILKDGEVFSSGQKTVGSGDGMTSNAAEYYGLIESVSSLKRLGVIDGELKLITSSQIVQEAVSERFLLGEKCDKHKKFPHLKELLELVIYQLRNYNWEIVWVEKGKNIID